MWPPCLQHGRCCSAEKTPDRPTPGSLPWAFKLCGCLSWGCFLVSDISDRTGQRVPKTDWFRVLQCLLTGCHLGFSPPDPWKAVTPLYHRPYQLSYRGVVGSTQVVTSSGPCQNTMQAQFILSKVVLAVPKDLLFFMCMGETSWRICLVTFPSTEVRLVPSFLPFLKRGMRNVCFFFIFLISHSNLPQLPVTFEDDREQPCNGTQVPQQLQG